MAYKVDSMSQVAVVLTSRRVSPTANHDDVIAPVLIARREAQRLLGTTLLETVTDPRCSRSFPTWSKPSCPMPVRS